MRLAAALLGIILVVLGMGGVLSRYIEDVSKAVGEYSEAEREYERLQCLRALVLTEVPSASVVRISEPDPYWYQRLLELTAPERLITDRLDEANAVLSVVRVPDGPCDGFDITVAGS